MKTEHEASAAWAVAPEGLGAHRTMSGALDGTTSSELDGAAGGSVRDPYEGFAERAGALAGLPRRPFEPDCATAGPNEPLSLSARFSSERESNGALFFT